MAEEWHQASAADLGRGIADGRIDPVALTESFLEAIAHHPDAGRIYARATPERALAEAEAARIRALDGSRLGPLDGVPASWKDLFDTAGVATEAGSRLLAGRTPGADAEVVRRGAAAGLVCLGKTHLSELAFSGLGFNPMTATPPNRYDQARVPGGSSSGAAASVVFGLAALGMGSDTGGSVRIPAAWNGLVGLKTTAGLVPTEGAVPLSRSLDTVGPLVRTVEDAALALGLLTASDTPEFEGLELSRTSFLLPGTVVTEGCDPEVEAGFADALERLARSGAVIARAPLPALADALTPALVGAVVSYEAWREWGAVIEANPGVMYERIETRFRTGEPFDETAHGAALQRYDALRADVVAAIEAHGPLIMPTCPNIAPKIARLEADPAYFVECNLTALRNTRLANMLGLSAITVPTGVPMVGVMLVGRPGDDARLLAAGRAVERALG